MRNDNHKVALVLGGGSARGIAHLGVLKVLKREKIPVDLVVGTSVGSLMGAVFALGLSLEPAINTAMNTSWKNLSDFVISKMGLLEGRDLERVIGNSIGWKNFEDLKIPLAVVATDAEKGEEVVYTSGNLVKIIRASCSIPGVFIPVRLDGRLLIDGGIKNTVAVSAAKRMEADFIIAVDVGFCIKKGAVTNIFQVIFQAVQIMGQELNDYQTMSADVVIRPDLGDLDQLAFHRAQEAIEKGEKAAEEALPYIKKRLEEKGIVY